ncbi:MAG: C45 family peptidase [Deltaproteobacteria bacterium]|nr:C45 family peptidase [Deltaproteobacteria bacterium]
MYDELNLPRDHYRAGFIIGQRSRKIMHEYVLASQTWQSLKAWIGSEKLKNMENAARAAFADYVDELAGIADGCELPFAQVFLWNCRGDLTPFISDGCTTVWAPSADGVLLGHNEDGDPNLRPHCFISKREPGINHPGYTSFTYPASINGHTFSVNSAGLVQLVDNIRSLEHGDGVPRQLLSRSILDCRSLEDVVATLKDCFRAGSFHHMLAQSGSKDVLSIEYTPDEVSMVRLQASYGHTNHFIHPRLRNSKQRITPSSAQRQIRIDDLCRKLSDSPGPGDIRMMLGDIENPDLPIYRTDPNDPDNENTLATALFRVTPDAVYSSVYIAGDQEQSFAGIENSL